MARTASIPWPLLSWAALALAAAGLFCRAVYSQLAAIAAEPTPALADLQRVILTHGLMPRAAVAVLAGAALGLAGLMLQRSLRNPLAEPSTLGISAGAQLAMVAATLYAPAFMDGAREAVALAGGLAAVGLIFSLTLQRGLEPVSVVLAGMMVTMTATAASAALILANGEYMMSLFIWGGGSLTQQDWSPAFTIASRLAVVAVAAFLLIRPLAVLGLDDAGARSLGVSVPAIRLLAIGFPLWLATTVTAEVGVIAFVGLAAPALARLSGARTWRAQLVAAPLTGAILLWLTDGLVQLAAGAGGERLPTGAATALLGGPLLLWLLPRLRMMEWPSLSLRPAVARRAARPGVVLGALAATLVAMVLLALAAGRGPDGWSIATGSVLVDMSAWRTPRIAIAAAAGAMLAATGVVIQRITVNPLASPEILGIGAGAGVGLAAVLFLASAPGLPTQFAGASVGALMVLAAILALARRGDFGPERLILAGIAISAFCSAVLTAIIASGNRQAFDLLRWLSGSTNGVTPVQAWSGLAMAVLLIVPLPFTVRWLTIMPLGSAVPRGLGLAAGRARLVLVVLSGLLTAVASLFVGPLSYVGLIAPHLARLIGLAQPLQHLAGAILIGAGLMVLSDWLARMAAFPYQLPLGLFAALVGGPYLIYLLAKGQGRHG